MLVFEERGKPEYLEKNLSEQMREPTNGVNARAGLFEAGLRSSRFSFISSAYNLVIGYSKKNRENFPRECF